MLFDVFFHGKTRKMSISLTNNYGSRTKNVKFSYEHKYKFSFSHLHQYLVNVKSARLYFPRKPAILNPFNHMLKNGQSIMHERV